MKTHPLKSELTEYQKLNEFKENCILPKVEEYEKRHREYKNNPQKAQSQGKPYSGNNNKKSKNGGNSRGKESESAYSDGGTVGNRISIPIDWNK